MKDWEIHNARFARPTKRMLDTLPPIQAFPPRSPSTSAGDVAAAIGIAVALVAVIALW